MSLLRRRPGTSRPDYRLLLGIVPSGQPVHWQLAKEPHALVVGGPGSGRTALARTVASQASGLALLGWEVDVHAPAGWADANDWPGTHLFGSREVTVDALQALADVVVVRRLRRERLAPPILVVVDPLEALSALAMPSLVQVLAWGPPAGVHVLVTARTGTGQPFTSSRRACESSAHAPAGPTSWRPAASGCPSPRSCPPTPCHRPTKPPTLGRRRSCPRSPSARRWPR